MANSFHCSVCHQRHSDNLDIQYLVDLFNDAQSHLRSIAKGPILNIDEQLRRDDEMRRRSWTIQLWESAHALGMTEREAVIAVLGGGLLT